MTLRQLWRGKFSVYISPNFKTLYVSITSSTQRLYNANKYTYFYWRLSMLARSPGLDQTCLNLCRVLWGLDHRSAPSCHLWFAWLDIRLHLTVRNILEYNTIGNRLLVTTDNHHYIKKEDIYFVNNLRRFNFTLKNIIPSLPVGRKIINVNQVPKGTWVNLGTES